MGWTLGDEGAGFVSVMQGFDYSRAIIGLACLGAAQESHDEALQWARDRVAFGEPIGRFQGVSFPLAEAATMIRGARHVCLEALWRKDNKLEIGDGTAQVSKLVISRHLLGRAYAP